MSKPIPQKASGWAVCDNLNGLLVFTVSRTRREAIDAFLEMYSGDTGAREWTKAKRLGFRVSHVVIEELLFQGREG